MDYPLESLSPEKFQVLCQSLLVKEHPNVQCLPVAQPDGGRDAMMWHIENKPSFVMFQIKFVREPHKVTDAREWLDKIINGELAKIKRQSLYGAKQYYLITNLKGSAHPDVGLIDVLNNALRELVGIPAMGWWRDDLCRRLDNAWDLKWAFPELMTGPDLIRFVLESGLSEDKQRRTSALRAFIKNQHLMDREVKFKQVELQNKLLDLFIDVPIVRTRNSTPQPKYMYVDSGISHYQMHGSTDFLDFEDTFTFEDYEPFISHYEPKSVGSATFILLPSQRNKFNKLVIEGAPGQGKSTITQYICQVHRMRLLNVRDEVASIPPIHRDSPMRLPLRVDLRDFASWLARACSRYI